MELLVWLFIIACFGLSFVGLIYPIIPSVLLIWLGVLAHVFLLKTGTVSWWTWGTFIVLTLVLFLADFLANLFFVERSGGSRLGMRAATIGLIVGSFIFPPFGILVVLFLLVLSIELLQKRPVTTAARIAFATLLAFISGTFAKVIIQLIMIIVFIIDTIV